MNVTIAGEVPIGLMPLSGLSFDEKRRQASTGWEPGVLMDGEPSPGAPKCEAEQSTLGSHWAEPGRPAGRGGLLESGSGLRIRAEAVLAEARCRPAQPAQWPSQPGAGSTLISALLPAFEARHVRSAPTMGRRRSLRRPRRLRYPPATSITARDPSRLFRHRTSRESP